MLMLLIKYVRRRLTIMFQKKRYVYLTADEIKVVAKSLIRLKNSLIQQGRYTDCVDELIVKVLGSQVQ